MHLALDWGSDAVRAILCDDMGRSLVALKAEAASWARGDGWDALRQAARDVLARSPRPVPFVRSAVLAAPSQVLAGPAASAQGSEPSAPRAEAIAQALREDLGIGLVRVTPRLEAAARAEEVWGNGREQMNWMLLLIEDELSSAAWADGRRLRGAHGAGGDIGAVCIERDGALSAQGTHGSLEAYCSLRALAERARSYSVAFSTPGELWAQAPHDWTARSLCEEFTTRLAQGIGVAVSLLNPSRVLLAGTLGEAVMRDLPAQIELRLSSFCSPAARAGLQVLEAHFGADAAIMGAAALAIEPAHN